MPDAELPEMSGGVQDSDQIRQPSGRSDARSSNDHVLSERRDIRPEEPEVQLAPPTRRQSFFVVPDRRRDTDHEGNALPPEPINITPAQRVSTFELGKSKKRRKKKLKKVRKSSLDAILRHAFNGPLIAGVAAQIPLPDTKPSSLSESVPDTSRELFSGQRESSLEIIQQHDRPPSPSGPAPSSIPLPESKPPSLEEPRETQSQPPQSARQPEPQQQPQSFPQLPIQRQMTYAPPQVHVLPPYNYDQIIAQSSRILKHLEHGRIQVDTRHNERTRISYVDYYQTPRPLIISHPDPEASDLSILGMVPNGVKQRVVVAEDLSPATINILGRRFGITPEFFEEHLINSGYDGMHYNDQPAHTWSTSSMKKSYYSMRWHRPGIRMPIVPFSENDLKELLDPAIARLEYILRSRHVSIYQTETNIFRPQWDLWTDPRVTTQMERTCGWEERISIWTETFTDRDLRIVVVLLDPMPSLGQGIERDVLLVGRRVQDSDSERTVDTFSTGTFSTRTPRSQREIDAEELDRLAEHAQKHELMRPAQQTWVQKLLRRLTNGGERDKANESGSDLSEKFEFLQTKRFEPIRSRFVFEQGLSSQRTKIQLDYESAFRSPRGMDILRQRLANTQSTSEEFWQRLTPFLNTNYSCEISVVIQPLFNIIHQDSVNLIKLLHTSLDGINVEILDDTKMEERLSMWRQLITRAQLELPELKRSAIQLLSFFSILDLSDLRPTLDANADTDDPEHTLKDSMSKDLKNLCKQIDDMMERLQTASSSLTSNMALLDSRRSIAEAQAVTKLTELAFFFIPISFAATLFGMQIEEFDNRAPLWTFVVVGLSFVAAAYLVRLIIRSTWLRNLLQASRASIRVYADSRRISVQRGSLPASLFLSWMVYEFNGIARASISSSWRWLSASISITAAGIWHATEFIINTLLIISIVSVAPITVLWTRNIDRGIKILITIVILISVTVLFALPYWRRADPDVRAALPRLITKRVERLHISTSTLLIVVLVLCALAIAAVPLAIIYTRPVAAGIRAAITVVIVLFILLGFVYWLVYRLVSVARLNFLDVSSSGSGSVILDD